MSDTSKRLLGPNSVLPIIIDMTNDDIYPLVVDKLPLKGHYMYYVYHKDGEYIINTDMMPDDEYMGFFITTSKGKVIRFRGE